MPGTANGTALSPAEATALRTLEATIERGFETFIEVGTALMQIHERKLYRDVYMSFDEYCRARWDFTERRARQLMGSARIAAALRCEDGQDVGTIVPAPTNEAQARPLAALPAGDRAGAWKEAVGESNGHAPTGKKVQQVVDRIMGKSRVNGELVDDPADIAALRADGRIRPDAVPVVVDTGERTTVADVAEAIDEGRAKSDDDLSDEDWLAAFPLLAELQGLQKRTFRDDALSYRRLQRAKKSYGLKVAEEANRNRKMGPWLSSQRFAMKQAGPEAWKQCPPPAEGGCGGSGVGTFGACPTCRGCGFWIPK